MPLSPGEKLGPYEILSAIGAGGQGEVYTARDTRLDRTVAVKVLPEYIAKREDLRARFEREARAVASLKHPNICVLHDIGKHDGVGSYMVMEFMEGETLAARIEKGALPLDQALKFATQIADALDRAHRAGVTHRDVKPQNIMLTRDGVKVLDFGLAKSSSKPGPTEATLTAVLTTEGTVMGTPQYMAPEQFEGKEADARSDIWAFGAVLYEMVTGQKAFQGKSYSSLLGAILSADPPPMSVKPFTPAWLERLVKRCLQKDPDDRYQSMRDVVLELQAPPQESAALGPPKASRWPWAVAGVAGALALALAAVSFLHFRETPPPEQTLRATIAAPENSTVHSFAISPDGRTLVIAARVNGKQQLWLWPMDALQFQPMAFAEDATYPFWSPDSRTIGFFAQGKLKKIAASGGPAQSLCDVASGYGGSWNRDDVIVFSPNTSGVSIQRISATGGAPADVTKTKGVQVFPVFLPGSSHLLYEMRGAAETTGIYVSSLDGRENRRVLPDASGAVFAPAARGERAGHLLFVREDTLMSAPFDPVSAQISGDVVPVSDGVPLNGAYLPVAVSENGVLLYAAGGSAGGLTQLSWFDRTGKSLGPVGVPGNVLYPAISPDEKSVAFARASSGGTDLWVRDLGRGTETRFTSDASGNIAAFWSPKGDRIVFASNRTGVYNLYQRATGGSGQDEPLLPISLSSAPTQWSRDGRFIVYHEFDPKTKLDLWILPTEGAAPDRKPIPFLRTEANDLQGQLSPDSHWMAFTSDRSGKREVYVRPFPPSEGDWTISLAGGQAPRWSGDGKELFFEAADGKMMAVAVKAVTRPKPSFEAGAPVPLFDAHIVHPNIDVNIEYDVTADGRRFLINTVAGSGGGSGASSPPLTVVTNWQTGFKK